MASAGAGRVIALDFDGVVCDSVGESGMTSFKAAALQWPEIFATPEAEARKDELMDGMRAVRPVIETGYENIVQIRALYEGYSPEEVLESWHELLPALMVRWQLQRAPLVELFGRVRDDWIAEDEQGWLAPNRIYPGVAEALTLSMKANEIYIVTTKQAHFTHLLLTGMAKVDFPADRIFSQTVSGRPKSEVLEALASKHPGATSLAFVEDKMSTLEKVAKLPEMHAWQLYLVDWGYNTVAERERAAASERITVLNVEEFAAMLAAPQ